MKMKSIMKGYKYLPLRNLEKVKAASERLEQVIIEKQDFEKLIARFNTPNTFFYLDPLYYTKEHLYDREDADTFSKHEELAAILMQIKGKFLLSNNNDPYTTNPTKASPLMKSKRSTPSPVLSR